jgi:hypothetical protein
MPKRRTQAEFSSRSYRVDAGLSRGFYSIHHGEWVVSFRTPFAYFQVGLHFPVIMYYPRACTGWYIPSHPIIYWYTVGHPIGAGISCTIPNSELGYCVPSQDKYWYILAKIWDGGPKFGLLGHCRRLAVSNRGPKFRP